jgi:hypothetical protein
MTDNEIINLAQKAGWDMGQDLSDGFGERLKKFTMLVAVAVGAACLKECEKIRYSGYCPPEDGRAPDYYNDAAIDCAEAIQDIIKNKFQFIKIGDV